MTLRYLLDSVILIDHFNGIESATDFLAAHHAECAISPITCAEVLAGFEAAKMAPARALLERLSYINLGLDDAELAAKLRRRRRWKLPDALQAALAIKHGLKLVTRNTKELSPRRDHFVLVPYTLDGSR